MNVEKVSDLSVTFKEFYDMEINRYRVVVTTTLNGVESIGVGIRPTKNSRAQEYAKIAHRNILHLLGNDVLADRE